MLGRTCGNKPDVLHGHSSYNVLEASEREGGLVMISRNLPRAGNVSRTKQRIMWGVTCTLRMTLDHQ